MISSVPRILFVIKRGSYDSYSENVPLGVYYSVIFLKNALTKIGVDTKVVLIDSDDQIEKEIITFNPTYISIQCLVVQPDVLVRYVERYQNITWGVRIHSKIPFLATDYYGIQWLSEYINKITPFYDNFSISTNSKPVTKELHTVLNEQVLYLPNVYLPNPESDEELLSKTQPLEDPPAIETNTSLTKHILNIGCFGALRPLKNHLLQAVAAIQYADENDKKINFHINVGKDDNLAVLNNLRSLFKQSPKHELVENAWVTHSDFMKVVEQMDLGMQVSLSESFSFITADFISKGVPIVVSTEISWLPPLFQADPNKATAIVKVISFALRSGIFGPSNSCKKALLKYNEIAIEHWSDYIDQ